MKIGLIGAMHDEIAALKNEMMITGTKTVARMEFTEGSIGNTEVVAVQSGIGKVNAAICAQILIDHFGVTHIINHIPCELLSGIKIFNCHVTRNIGF